jgi:MYXO-CTERM domain-containing protein
VNADRHPDSATLHAFRQHRLSGPDVLSVGRHLGHCAECAAATAADAEAVLRALVLPAAEDQRSDDAPPSRRWWLAAAAALALAASIVVTVSRRSPAPEIASRTVPAPSVPAAPIPAAPHAVAALADASGRIELHDDGTVTGIEAASPADAATARAVLSGGSFSIPTVIAAMPGLVRGRTHAELPPIRPLEPFRSAVREPRPRFAWTAARNARSYRVAVFDANYEEVASSEPLTATSWRPSKPLPAGVDLTWHVVANTPEGEISSAGPDRAEAVFRVLSAAEAQELSHGEALYGQSHFLRGLLYCRLGLLRDAEREFRALEALNPQSRIAAKLIAPFSARE